MPMDEGNLFNEETLEARAELEYLSNAKFNILSAQSNKPEMVIVQDSLLAAYQMTKTVCPMSKGDFMNCLFKTNALDTYDYLGRLAEIQELRNEKILTAAALFGFLLPADFHISYPDTNMVIKYGVVVSGYFDKSILKGTPKSIIRILCMEYGEDITASFIDNIQFITNAWLEINPFTVGIVDCLIGDKEKTKEIKEVVNRYFIEADQVKTITDNSLIREARVNCALNKAKDIGMRLAKETLKPDNNFISTVTSGSKGDYFNIAQITGLLGQQNLGGKRPEPTLDNKKRTLIHYPKCITDNVRKYESRGFVASSFIGGMNPKEMFFHAMTGREGMTKTAMGTALSGYIQRSNIKLNEDLKIEYDGTVRDANANIYQHQYGNHGFDPCQVTFLKNGEVQPVDIPRLARRLNGKEEGQLLTSDEIEEISQKCKWIVSIPEEIFNPIWGKHEKVLRRELNKIKLIPEKFDEFSEFIITKYHTSRTNPGDCVGIIGAQSIGERQTQTTLNTFHTAGKLQQSGVGRFEEIMNMTKKIKVKTCILYFKKKYTSPEDLRRDVGCTIVGSTLAQLIDDEPIITKIKTELTFQYEFNMKTLFTLRITPYMVTQAIEREFVDCKCQLGSTQIFVTLCDIVEDCHYSETMSNLFSKIKVCGIEGITATHLDHNEKEWYLVTEGSNLRKLLAHPLIDHHRLYCNDFWELYECLGIAATRKLLLSDIKNVVVGVNDCHLQLLVDKMTFKGKPMSMSRFTMRTNDVGPLSKATFEESTDVIFSAAIKTETEYNNGVSAAIISGNQPKIGTGCMGLKIDYKKLMAPLVPDVYYD